MNGNTMTVAMNTAPSAAVNGLTSAAMAGPVSACAAVRSRTRPSVQSGFSLVELMVSLAIGLVVTLAIFTVTTVSEGRKRTTVSLNDTSQAGAYISYQLDRAVRSAGSGYSQRWRELYGCRLHAVRNASVYLPHQAGDPLPAPFQALSGEFRLAPLVIAAGQSAAGSDVLIAMTGTAGQGESPPRLRPGGGAGLDNILLDNTISFRGRDLVLVGDDRGECLLQEVRFNPAVFNGMATPTQQLPFETGVADAYYTLNGGTISLASMGADSFAVALGSRAGNAPLFQLFGVGENNTLFSHDILRLGGLDAAPLPISDGVVELRALYGLDTNDDGALDTWQDPSVAPFDVGTLTNGSAASVTNLRRIVAVRVALVLRTSLIEREVVAPPTLTLFAELPVGLQRDIALSADERRLRHRVVETTIPLRNVLLQPI